MKETPPASPSPTSLVDAVLSLSRVFVAIAARSLADTADDVTLAQYRTLIVLASRGPQRLSDLAENLAVTPATATRMCDRLVGKDLIRRAHERGDRRSVRLTLSIKGRELVDAVSVRRRSEILRLMTSVPQSDQSAVVAALHLLILAAGEVPDEDWSSGWSI